MSERTTLPVLPLRETVIFPGTAVPISAGRPGTLQAIEAALAGDRRMLAVAQRENRDEVEPENLFTVGTVVRIAQVQRGGGGVQLLIHGEHRAMALQYLDTPERGLTAHVREMHEQWEAFDARVDRTFATESGLIAFVATGPGADRLAVKLRDAPGVTAAAAFGATLHVCGPDRDALVRAIEPFRRDPNLKWEEAEPTLEDVFIHLMGRARDNALDG